MSTTPWRFLPALTITLIAAGLVAGQLVRLPSPGGTGAILLLDMAVLLADFLLIAKVVAERRLGQFLSSTLQHPVWRWSAWFLAWAALTLGIQAWDYTATQSVVALSYLLRLAAIFALGWLIYDTRQSLTWRFWGGLTVAGVVLLWLGFLQLIYVPSFAMMAAINGWDPHLGRMLSTFYDPNYFGVWLMLLMVMALARSFSVTVRSGQWWLSLGLFVVSWVGLYLTVSRSAWVGGIIAVSLLSFRHSWRLGLLILIIFIGVLFVPSRLGDRFAQSQGVAQTGNYGDGAENFRCQAGAELTQCDPSGSARIFSYQRGLKLWEKHPVFGVGYNAYGPALVKEGIVSPRQVGRYSGQGSDNSLLTVAATTGLPGLVLFVGFLMAAMRSLLRASRKTNRDWYAWGLLAFTIGWVAVSFLNNTLLYPSLLVPWIALLAVTLPSRETTS